MIIEVLWSVNRPSESQSVKSNSPTVSFSRGWYTQAISLMHRPSMSGRPSKGDVRSLDDHPVSMMNALNQRKVKKS